MFENYSLKQDSLLAPPAHSPLFNANYDLLPADGPTEAMVQMTFGHSLSAVSAQPGDLSSALTNLSADQAAADLQTRANPNVGQDANIAQAPATDAPANPTVVPTSSSSPSWVKYGAGALLGGGGVLAWNTLSKTAGQALPGGDIRFSKKPVPKPEPKVVKPEAQAVKPEAQAAKPVAPGGETAEIAKAVKPSDATQVAKPVSPLPRGNGQMLFHDGPQPIQKFSYLEGSDPILSPETLIDKVWLGSKGRIYMNPAGLEGVGSRTLAARFYQPFKVSGGAFDGMELSHLSAIPVVGEEGYHLVTAFKHVSTSELLDGGCMEWAKLAKISTEELQALLEGTTDVLEAALKVL